MSIEKLKFLSESAQAIIEQAIPPSLWSPVITTENEKMMYDLAGLKRPPFGSQVENGILPLVKGLETYKFGLLIAEMGTGKTQMSFSTAYLSIKDSKLRKLLFLTAGGKHIPKMIREAESIYGSRAEVYTIVNKSIFEKIGKKEVRPEDVVEMKAPEGKILIFVLSKDTAKFDLSTEPIFNWGDTCDKCHKMMLPPSLNTKKLPKGWFKEKKKHLPKVKPLNCPHCGHSLESKVAKNIWQGTQVFPNLREKMRTTGSRKLSVGKKFRLLAGTRKNKIFDMVIVDEVHEMQSSTSLQGRVYRDLVNVSRKALIMTGTLSNGYPSSVFFILQAIMPEYFKKLGYQYHDVGKFVDHYGARKYTRSKDIVETRGSKVSVKVAELPKISDRIVSLMAPFTAWLKMEDLNLKMPSYSESAKIVQMDNEVQSRLNEYRHTVVGLLSKYNDKLIKSFAQKFMYLQNNPTFPLEYEFEGEIVSVDPVSGATKTEKKIFKENFVPFPEESYFSKERELVNIVSSELKQGRRVLVYSIYNKAAEVANRVEKVLKGNTEGLDIKVMPENISGERIEGWIEENECDVLIASPLKLATGLDLTQFPTIIFYETGTNLRTVQQAARRSWRAVGQDKPVKVFFLAYNGIQAHILDIMAKKMRAAAVIEGKKVIEGQIASVFDDDADFTKALNNIANELETTFKPDFSSAHVEQGKLRPDTKLEARYNEILKEITGHNENDKDDEPNGFSGEEETKEEILVSVDDVEEMLAASAPEPIEEVIQEDSEPEPIETKTKVSSSGKDQLCFIF